MAQERNTPTTNPESKGAKVVNGPLLPSSNSARRNKLSLLIILIVVVIIGVGIYIDHRRHSTSSSDNQVYTNLSYYSVPGASANLGMSFELPKAFTKLTFKNNVVANQAVFVEQSTVTKSLVIGGASAGSTVSSSSQQASSFLTAYNNALKLSSTAFIQGQKSVAYSLISPSFPREVDLVYSLKAFTSSNVKTDAWVASFIVDSDGKTKTSKKTQIYQGQLFYGLTKNAIYHLMFYTTPTNWTNSTNQKVWPQVLDSIKLDQ